MLNVYVHKNSIMLIVLIKQSIVSFIVDKGRRTFSEVRTFLKRQPHENATYLTLTTEGGNQMTLSGNHLLFVSTNNKVEDMMARYSSFNSHSSHTGRKNI